MIFNAHFSPITWEGIGQDLVDKLLSGYNTCLFAYGQTGSGKTFTMMGRGSGGNAKPGDDVVPSKASDMKHGTVNDQEDHNVRRRYHVSPGGKARRYASSFDPARGKNQSNSRSPLSQRRRDVQGGSHAARCASQPIAPNSDREEDRGVIQRMCNYLFERSAKLCAHEDATATAYCATVDGVRCGNLNNADAYGGAEAQRDIEQGHQPISEREQISDDKRRSIKTTWEFRYELIYSD